nr:MAG: ORF1 [Torque teno midi virus]
MPFWWNRRNKYYTNYRYRWRRRRKPRYKRRKRIYRRRSRRAPTRRRRRRRTKVKKKKKFLKLLQWQPQSIRKCKITGIESLVLGANGRQFRNYTTNMFEWTPATVPGGGGFSTSKFSLDYLYEQYQLHNNIWTTSNTNYDLCRFTGSKLTFYRHPTTDFIVKYSRNYPMTNSQTTAAETHPHSLMLSKHKIVIPSLKHKPYGKLKITKKIKPPTQQVNKWFFQDSFSSTGLLYLQAAACDLHYMTYGPEGENALTNFLCIDTKFYNNAGWGKHLGNKGYMPTITWTGEQTVIITPYSSSTTTQVTIKDDYAQSVAQSTGWFQPSILKARQIQILAKQFTGRVIGGCRYNPTADTGKGNSIWLTSIITGDYAKPKTDKVLYFDDLPLWLLLYGWTDYVYKLKKEDSFFTQYVLVIQSPHIKTTLSNPANIHVPIDDSFIEGKGQYNSTVTDKQKQLWYPCLLYQQQAINNIVKCGPYIPKTEGKKSNWELLLKYTFFFKWGGAQPPLGHVSDPAEKPDYIVPDKLYQTIQIQDPKTQIPESILHTWDFRRGFATSTALKRMSDHLQPSTTLSTDSDYCKPPKRQKYSTKEPPFEEEKTEDYKCLQQLFKENIYQEETEETEDPIQKLIQQQQQQQQLLKHNLLKLISSLKKQQLQLQMHTGIIQ